MGIVRTIKDGLVNLVANLGTNRDKAVHTQYCAPTLTASEAVNAYRSAWLPRKIVDIPALDSLRNWRGWEADETQISAIEAEEKRLNLKGKLLDCYTKARLFGGAAIYIGIGDANPMEPLNPERIQKGGIRHLNVLTRRILAAGQVERNAESPNFGLPASYQLSGGQNVVDIHPSRLIILKGAEVPDAELAADTVGWGDSVLTAIFDAIRQADGTAANIASVVFEAKVDVISIPNFMASMQDPDFEAQMLARLQLAAMAKGINGCLILDKEETYEQKVPTLTGLTDILMNFMQIVSGAADIPVTRLLGQSPAGFSATGESDIRNYYDRIRSGQELVLGPAMEIFDECLIRSALGARPKEVFYNWNSLWQTSQKETADIGKTTADTIKTISDTGLIPEEVMTKVAVNMLAESGVAPGLEAEMADYKPPAEGEGPDDEELAAANTREAIEDAKPRTLYVRRDVVNVEDLQDWAAEQGITDLVDGLHVTVAYSSTALDWIKTGNANEWSGKKKDEVIIPEGGPRAVEPLGNMTAVLLFASSNLTYRHQEILRAGATHDFPEFVPHISLTKTPIDLKDVEPYRGPIVLGPEVFEMVRI